MLVIIKTIKYDVLVPWIENDLLMPLLLNVLIKQDKFNFLELIYKQNL